MLTDTPHCSGWHILVCWRKPSIWSEPAGTWMRRPGLCFQAGTRLKMGSTGLWSQHSRRFHPCWQAAGRLGYFSLIFVVVVCKLVDRFMITTFQTVSSLLASWRKVAPFLCVSFCVVVVCGLVDSESRFTIYSHWALSFTACRLVVAG